MLKRISGTVLLLLALALWLVLMGGIRLYIDYLWFDSVGYRETFLTILSARFYVWLAGFFVTLAALGVNLRIALRHPQGSYFLRQEFIEVVQSGSKYLVWVLILVLSALAGFSAQTRWMTFLQYLNQVGTRSTDPLFGRDIAFYLFSLPAWQFATHFLLVLVFLTLLLAAGAYLVRGQLGYLGGVRIHFGARLHLLLLLGSGFLLLAFHFWLQRFELLYNAQGVVFGAGHTDVYARLPIYWILVALSALSGVLFFVSILGRTLRLASLSGLGFLIGYLLLNAYPFLIQTFVVEPNELQREKPFIEHNIRMTSAAYNLDQIEVRDFTSGGRLTRRDLEENSGTIGNIRLWDWRPLKDAYNQLQSIRSYYQFEDVDLDRYILNGQYRQVMLSARELDFSKMPPQAQTWINRYFQYTHGVGLCLSPVNEVTPEGLPEFFIKDIPPRSRIDLKVDRFQIYFGEKTEHPVFVNTRSREFDYPVGDQNAWTTYQGKDGLKINSFFRKLLFAWELQGFQILFTENFTDESRVLLHRQIQQRVSRIAPFLRYDGDPYLVVHDGRLFWMHDAYTVTDRYPYSEPYQGSFNYIRNAVKVLVDAYHGEVTFYIADPEDAVIQVFTRIFPRMFRPLEEMPEGLRRHIRYPEGLFNIQTHMFRTYHMRDPTVFYNREDLWEIPNEIYRGNEQVMESYYFIMSLPGSSLEEFILLIPFTPKNKNNMIGWLAARSDGEHYGKLVLFQFTKQELTYGPMQIEARIDQDPDISQLITLWSQKGSQVIRGNLLVIPIENSLLYVEPLYLQAEKSEIPELTRVIAVYKNRVGLGETLQQALAAVIEGVSPEPSAVPSPAPEHLTEERELQALIDEARRHYQNSQQHLRRQDWAAYGEEQEKLGAVLEQLGQQSRTPDGRRPDPE